MLMIHISCDRSITMFIIINISEPFSNCVWRIPTHQYIQVCKCVYYPSITTKLYFIHCTIYTPIIFIYMYIFRIDIDPCIR